MASKEGFVDRDIFNGHGALAIELHDPIHEQEWVSMRKQLQKAIERLGILLAQDNGPYLRIVERPPPASLSAGSSETLGANLPGSRAASSPSAPGLTFIAS